MDQLTFPSSLVAAKNLFESADAPGGAYIDCHAWRFTPSSFQLAILELDALDEIHFSVDRLFATEGNGVSRHVTLRRGRDPKASEPALTHARLDLLGGVMAELQEQATWFMRGLEDDVNDQIQASETRSRLAWLRSVLGRDPS